MEQHAIPRQITSFEFKLIGFMTLKQFLYLLVFLPAVPVVPAIQAQVVTPVVSETPPMVVPAVPVPVVAPQPTSQPAPVVSMKKAFFTGIIKNNRKIPLPGVLVYVKDQNNTPLRL